MGWHINEYRADRIRVWLGRFSACLFLPVLAMMVAEFGFHLPDPWGDRVHRAEMVILSFVCLEFWFRIFLEREGTRLDYMRRAWLTYAMTGLLSVLLLFMWSPYYHIEEPGTLFLGIEAQGVTALSLMLFQVFVGIYIVRESATLLGHFAQKRIKPSLVAVLSFAFFILIGALALMMPKMVTEPLSFSDAFFTATSAVCVTGLTVTDTGTAFTQPGQCVLLLLIQIGGLGIMTLAGCVVVFFGGVMGFRERVMLQDFVQADGFQKIRHILARICLITFVAEGLGTVLLFWSWKEQVPNVFDRLWQALFHSISAFCNAGFSIVPGGLGVEAYAMSLPGLLVLVLLVIVGGLGIPVISDLAGMDGKIRRLRNWKMQTKVVVWSTLILNLAGFALIWFSENHAALEDLPMVKKAGLSLFLAVMPRTAGFQTMDFGNFLPATVGLMIIWMVIGGAPASTAGGLKVTTVWVVCAYIKSLIRGEESVQSFRREISESLCARSMALCVLYFSGATLATLLLVYMEPVDAKHALFEVVSALSTVGLSSGVSAKVGVFGKWLLIVCMFAGRLGILTLLWSFFYRDRVDRWRYPQENIMLF